MTLSRYVHTGAAPATGLASGITSSATSFTVLSGTGYPSPAAGQFFVVCIDAGATSEEKILCSARSGTTFTVATGGRGYDGTTAASHSAGTTNVTHVLSAAEVDDTSDHIYNTTRNDHTQYVQGVTAGDTSITIGGTSQNPTVALPTSGVAAGTYNSVTVNGKGIVTAGASGSSSGLLAIVRYNPATGVKASTTSTTPVAVDATNLTISFTAPASGKVLVRLNAIAGLTSNADLGYWGLLQHSTTNLVGDLEAVVSSTAEAFRATAPIYLTGLTAGQTYQYDWAHAAQSGATMSTDYGGANSTGANNFGPAIMEVWSA